MVSDADVDACCGILDLDKATHDHIIRSALRHHNNDINKVVNAWFEDDVKFRQQFTWDEGAFMAQRDGTEMPPTFNVQGPDETSNSAWQEKSILSAPSRPPSRSQNRSPLGAPTTQAQADEDLARALAESTAVSGGATPQDSGVINTDTSLPFFGPANRDSYDDDEWAMVRVNRESSDPPPSGRKRDPKVPVFLICRQSQQQKHRLGPLLMIMHEIPAARNFFLLLEGSSQSYGHHKEWFKGEPILSIYEPNEVPEAWAENYRVVLLVDELQRLMAFLDSTERSYGTADSLRECPQMKVTWADVIVRFYESLYNCSRAEELVRMWSTVKVDSATEESRPTEFAILEFRVQENLPDVMRNLYSQWDLLFWLQQDGFWAGRPGDEPTQIASIQVPAQVITMRIATDNGPIDVPEILYIDRWLDSHLESARDTQSKIHRLWKAIELAKEREAEITKWRSESQKEYDRTTLANSIIEKSKSSIWQIRATALWRMYESSIGTDNPLPYLPNELNHLAELNDDEVKAVRHHEAKIELAKLTLAKMERQLAHVRAEKEACCSLLKKLNKRLAVPSEDPSTNPTHKYMLRGVITSPEVVYMSRRRETEPFETETNCQDVDQWWRIAWVGGIENPIKQERTTIEKVMEAMFTEVDADNNIAPILVYATDEALADESTPLSGALQTFVKFDNRLFKQEILEEPAPREKKRAAARTSLSPPKRQRSGSLDSMASNRASVGDDFSDVGERDALLADQMDPFASGDGDHEMADMRPISHDEIAAHMVPPLTPPLSADDASDQDSSGLRRSSEKLAHISLHDNIQDADVSDSQQQATRSPEMEELKSHFIVRRPANGVLDKRVSIMERPMEIDGALEIPGTNPEDFYQQRQ